MKGSAVILLGLAASALMIIGIALATPPQDDFDLSNPYWNGLSKFKSRINPAITLNLQQLPSEVNPSSSTLFLIGPTKPFSKAETSVVNAFLERGGIVVVMDEYGSGNELLAELAVQASFTGYEMRDPLFRGKDSRLARIIDLKPSLYTANVSSLMLNCAATLWISTEDKRSEVLAYSSYFSYLDENLNGLPDEGEPKGPFPIIARIAWKNGTLILVSDSSLFINAMIDEADNNNFLSDLAAYRQVLIDTSHWEISRLTLFKAQLTEAYGLAKANEVKYTLLATLAVLTFKLQWVEGKEEDEVEKVSKTHPEWNKELLNKLEELRNEHGVEERREA